MKKVEAISGMESADTQADRPKERRRSASLTREKLFFYGVVLPILLLLLVSCSTKPTTVSAVEITRQARANAAGAISTLMVLGTEFPAPLPTSTPVPTSTPMPTPTRTPFSGVEIRDGQGNVFQYPTYAAPNTDGLLGSPGKTRVEIKDGTPVPGTTTYTPEEWPWVLGGITIGSSLAIGLGAGAGAKIARERSRYSSRVNRKGK
ncbi:hypothetical protein KJ707_04470 [Patescibacteria group bacterium]|nr:hypothetical protein [Patescibacteria group bacterium]MBU1966693.1 hypothetical protein [Patescibacteria group bacterium]MBU2543787.1 hypothetical protein [Patescibacteria group bacterium]